MNLDITQELKNTENSLRDFLYYILHENFGNEWFEKSGLNSKEKQKCFSRKEKEEKLHASIDERPLYYADFRDLKKIINKHWESLFENIFDDEAQFSVFFDILANYRNSDAHRRELLPNEKHLLIGMAGEIRGKITKYRSKKETAEDCFPRIEFAKDNMENTYSAGEWNKREKTVLYPGDILEFVVTASDPEGKDLLYSFSSPSERGGYQENNCFIKKIDKNDIGINVAFKIHIKSTRDYHAHKHYDDFIACRYDILPK